MLVQVSPTVSVPTPGENGQNQITYVVDRGLVTYLKTAAGVAAILIGVAAFTLGIDIHKGLQDMESQVAKAHKVADEASQAAAKIAPSLEQIQKNAEKADETTKRIQNVDTDLNTRMTEILKSGGFVSEDRARKIFEDLMVATAPKLQSNRGPDDIRNAIKQATETAYKSPEKQAALQKIQEELAYAVDYLNKVLDLKFQSPPIKLLESSYKNTFWDGKAINAPPQAQYIPDLLYHEVAHEYIEALAHLEFRDEAGAMNESFADVFASLIKQKRLNQTAQNADWLIAPGGVAWILDQDIGKAQRAPKVQALGSMRAPGTAYNDPVLGKDPQVAHMRDYRKTTEDNGGIHINKGIPNKAFYETAIRIGSEKAGMIWTQALRKLHKSSGFQDSVAKTYQLAGELYARSEQETVKSAWDSVGLNILRK